MTSRRSRCSPAPARRRWPNRDASASIWSQITTIAATISDSTSAPRATGVLVVQARQALIEEGMASAKSSRANTADGRVCASTLVLHSKSASRERTSASIARSRSTCAPPLATVSAKRFVTIA
jgi:hypothetical protein